MPTQLTVDNLPCCDMPQAFATLDDLGYPAPPEMARANSIMNPLGSAPCRAWLLMTRVNLNSLSKETTTHQIALQDAQGNKITLYKQVFVKARCLTPGISADANGLYLAEFSDQTWLVNNPTYNCTINKQYNVPAAAMGSGAYYYDTTNAGTAWTWATMWADLWTTTVGSILGTTPALPVTPNGAPTAFIFPGISGWEAINQVLARIGCALNLNPLASGNQFSVIQVGAADSAATTLLSQNASRKIHDEEFIESSIGKVPSGVTVYFHKANQDYGTENTTGSAAGKQWSTGASYQVSIAGPSGVPTGGVNHPIWDDLQALYDASGTLTNSSALNTRAQERANDFYRWIQAPGGDFLHRTYSGLIPFDTGSIIRGVAWRQDGNGAFVTEAIRHPYGRLVITDAGQWEEEDYDSSTALQPPDLRPAYPNYPHYLQTVRITSDTPDGSGRYSAFVELLDPSALTYTDQEACFAFEANSGTLGTGRYLARLSGNSGGSPLYQVVASVGSLTITGNIYEPPVSVTINVTQNNYNLPRGATINLNITAQLKITGFLININRVVQLKNTGTKKCTLTHADSNSSSGNQMYYPNGLPYDLQPNQTLDLKHDPGGGSGSGWYPVGPGGQGGGPTNGYGMVGPGGGGGGPTPPVNTDGGAMRNIQMTDGGRNGGTLGRTNPGPLPMADILPNPPYPGWSTTVNNSGGSNDVVSPPGGVNLNGGSGGYTIPPGATATFSTPDGVQYFTFSANPAGSTSPGSTGGAGAGTLQQGGPTNTTTAYVTLFDITNANGLSGGFTVRNFDSVQGAQLRITYTDTRGNATTITAGVGAGGGYWRRAEDALNGAGTNNAGAMLPTKEVKVEIQDNNPPNHVSYNWDHNLR